MNNGRYNQKFTLFNEKLEKPDHRVSGLFFSITILLIFVASLIFQIVMTAIANGRDISNESWYIYSSFLVSTIALLITILICLKLSGLSFFSCAPSFKINVKFSLITAMLFVGMFFGLSYVNDAVIKLFEKIGYKSVNTELPPYNALNLILCTIIIGVLPAFFEEIIFRGFILCGLKHLGEMKAVFISATLFAFFHLSPSKTAYQFLAGVIFALIAIKSNSLLPSMLLHFLNNFAVILNYYVFKFDPKGTLKVVLVSVGLVVLLVGVALLFIKSNKKKRVEGNEVQEQKSKNSSKKEEKTKWLEFVKFGLPGFAVSLILWFSNLFM